MAEENIAGQVTRLAGDVSDHAERLERLEKRPVGADRDEVAELAGQVSELREGFETFETETQASLDTLAEQVGEALAAGEDSGERVDVAPESWLDVSVGRAPAYLAEVLDWAQTVAPNLDPELRLQQCWYRHPAVVQLLADSRAMWRWVYRSGAARPYEAIEWQTRHWPAIHKQLHEMLKNCDVQGEHEDPYPVPAGHWTIQQETAARYEQDAQQWAARSGRPAPEPEL